MRARQLAWVVEPAQEGARLDRYLAEPLGSRAAAQSLIEEGQVRVNGTPRPKRHLLRAGDRVEAVLAPPEASVGPSAGHIAPFAIAYEDEHLLVVDKPAGVVVHPARGHQTGTLAQALSERGQGGESFRAGIVHRLDRDTSGLLVVAKSEQVHRALKTLLSSRRISREYLALVDGHPPARTGTIEAPIGRDRRDRLKVSLDSDVAREARTHFELERSFPTTSLLRVRLETGRTHQIRVHLAAIGHPICGDPLYGEADRLGLSRQFLHAERLAFEHPVSHQALEIHSPLPEDLAAALEQAALAAR